MTDSDYVMLSDDGEETTLDDIKRESLQRAYFTSACAPSPFHWHFQQAYEALITDLYLPGVSGLLNGIEASLRTTQLRSSTAVACTVTLVLLCTIFYCGQTNSMA